MDFYRRSTADVARDLLGRYLVRRQGSRRLVARLVETEAYLGTPDRASHAWNERRTARTASLYRRGGYAYVYFIYGMYFCLNAVTEGADNGCAVLIRAAEPVSGESEMTARRGLSRPPRPGDLLGGPGKLCQALDIDRRHDGVALYRGELLLTAGEPVGDEEIARGPRVGIDYAGEAVDWPLRFALRGNRHMSRPRW